jgi:hypothetical protein
MGFTQALTEMSTGSRKMFLGSTAQREREADNITAIYEQIVLSLDASQPYRPPLPATGIALPLITNSSVVLIRWRTTPTERSQFVGEVSANFCGQRGVAWSARRIPTAVISVF